MSRNGRLGGAWACAALGIALGEVWAPGGIALGILAFMLGLVSIKTLNDLAARITMLGVSVLHGVGIWRASGSAFLGAVPVAFGVLAPPWETVSRRYAYSAAWMVPVSFLVGVVLTMLARPWGAGHLAAVPLLLVFGAFATSITLGQLSIRRAGRRVTAKLGETFPDVTLPARLGRAAFRLADHRGRHVLVCLLRGDWCPVCHVMMRIIAKDAPVLESHGVKVVAVSPQEGAEADAFARTLGVDYDLLVDPGCTLAAALGAVHPDEPARGQSTNLPAMFLVDPEGKLLFVSTALDLTLHDPRRVLRFLPPHTVA